MQCLNILYWLSLLIIWNTSEVYNLKLWNIWKMTKSKQGGRHNWPIWKHVFQKWLSKRVQMEMKSDKSELKSNLMWQCKVEAHLHLGISIHLITLRFDCSLWKLRQILIFAASFVEANKIMYMRVSGKYYHKQVLISVTCIKENYLRLPCLHSPLIIISS